jgi:aspartyl protease family protein
MKSAAGYFSGVLLLWLIGLPGWATEVRVIGLFTDKALLMIGGEQKILANGDTYKGVTLESASGRGAVVLINGERQKLGLNQSIHGSFKKPARSVSKIIPDSQGMYKIYGKINEQSVLFIVDTGATHVTLSGALATRLGVDFKKGQRGLASTAASTVPVWKLKLDSVSVGDIKVHNVDASVIEGSNLHAVLLGNSFLKHTELQRVGTVMELQKKY